MSEQNVALKCPFRAPIMTRSFGCIHSEEITRREGPDVACNSSTSNALCHDFFNNMKSRALDALGHEDDLTTMPASVLQKIQYGGLLGLQQQVSDKPDNVNVDNVAQLMDDAIVKYDSISGFPFDACVESIKSYKMRKRRGR
ncbi:MAG: hypothetical protein PVJ39_10735 [Gammaproteobacteria bacterium]|jgi:hypothetical protein